MDRTELLKIAKPILFNTEMAKAILDGRKTVTRRVVKPQPTAPRWNCIGYLGYDDGHGYQMEQQYKVGDILYVRETWGKHPKQDIFYYRADSVCNGKSDEWGCPEPYDKTNNCILCEWCDGFIKWRPSIHMPKSAARIFLKVTGVRVERLQDMYVDDAINEGAWGNGIPILPFSLLYKEHPKASCNAIASFAHLWDSTMPKKDIDRYGWEANPWVWVYEFERVECDERK